ncbi:MAG: hypothetical protein BWX72_00137 [Firmicutes bacterium ADurb.Bin080]|nr:MAG: hypothetical protein BWX72_00137 [Firmicutes bacterium ADurb.Bin080]
MAINEPHPKHPNFASILTDRVVEQFFVRLNVVSHIVDELLIVSPVLGTLSGTKMPIERLKQLIRVNKIQTYLVTRSPENDLTIGAPGHRPVLETLGNINGLEIRYNDALHAKIYVCICKDPQNNFAVVGSANMTRSSIERNIEVGILIRYAYQGRELIDELGYWIKNKLRLQTQVAKPIVK